MSTRSFLFSGVVLATLFAPTLAAADEIKECATAYEQAQRLEKSSELFAAIEAADQCAKPACPEILRNDCTKWAVDWKAKLPSLVLHVRGGDGCMRPQAEVSIDGTFKQDGATLFLDPGTHKLTVTDPRTNQTREQSLNMAPGEKRDIDVDFARPGAVCPRPEEVTPIGKVPTISLIAGTVGAGFVLFGAGFGIIGAVKRGDLDSCKPTCTDDQVDGVRPWFIAGDVFAGVGLVAVALGAISYFVLQPRPSRSTPAMPATPGTKTGWFLGPTGAGATF